ncbi:hypothetical protein K1X22_01225 [Mycolicibacterium farcinogenes]|uniref:hypothetical protein n=1 Tax=Mycolicibacterium farcinogenes TaxID=1802 RepID=UPI001C8E53D5|nr:hypothetical protein [Mycolicibacterium farcinogenes]QZH60482.1 hypothetical protein K1X22_01225 [Mycolicibacterium farcinogenes]
MAFELIKWLEAVAADEGLLDSDLKVAAALADNTVTVPGKTPAEVCESVNALMCAGWVESVARIPCDDHGIVKAPNEPLFPFEYEAELCGTHLLRLCMFDGTASEHTVPWLYCQAIHGML